MDVPNNPKAIKMPVAGLEVGMYVSQLDKDWLDSPFLFQGFMIESLDDIRLLEKECAFVWIDPALEIRRGKDEKVALKKPVPQKTRYINKLTMPREYEKSRKLFETSRQRTKTILDDVVLSGAINTQEAKKTVEGCLDSILRNPNAMLWMSKVRETNSYTADHSLNVCILAIAFGRHLGYTKDELFSLGMCGLLHDVGKMRIPNEVLNKPDKLLPKEWKQVQAHVILGRNLLMTSPGIGHSVDVAYSHHERVDGTGYPRGLNGGQISQYTKIISLADSFDAMTAERCYSKAMTASAAVKEIYRCRGTQFDERLALQFIKTIGLYPPGTIAELANGCLGLVLERSQKYQHLPRLLLLRDSKKILPQSKVIDLSLIEQGKLDRGFLIKHDHPDGYAGIKVADYKDFIVTLE
jgi:HD-GYP domain-containing protein (c-di-GMP phosphodiesterase class II)